MPDQRALAAAFSGHRFEEVYPYLADDLVWALPGSGGLVGKEAAVQACEQTAAGLADTSTEFLRFLVVGQDEVVAVDAVARYTDADGGVSVVSSSDFYEWRDDRLVAITSYAVELDAANLAPTSFITAD